MRIPERAAGTTLKINAIAYDGEITPGTYLELNDLWKSGDLIEFEFPMEVRLIQSHPRVAENRNHVAVMRGPVVFCLEDVDLPEGVKLSEIHLPKDPQFERVFRPELLGGVTILKTAAIRKSRPSASDGLYRPYIPATQAEISIELIPYYAWANRGVFEMAVWMPMLME